MTMNMNIVDFTKSLSYDNLETDLLRYFDENMILYRLMGGVPGVVVSSISNSTKAIYRISSTDASTDLNILAQYINNTITAMYGAIYKTVVTFDGKDLLITFDN